MCAVDEWHVDELRVGRPSGRELRRPHRRRVRRGARPAVRPLPERRLRGAAAARGVGPRRAASSARARAPAASPSRTRARSPTAASSACSSPTGPASASSTRRWCTRAGAARCSCWAPARGGSRTSRATASSSSPRPGEPGKMPFWKGDKPGPPARARPRDRARSRASSRPARRADALKRLRDDVGLDELRGRELWSSTLTISARRPAPSPTTARSSSNGSATSSATGACASCRRSASACTRRGAWRSRRGSRSASAPARRCSGATTASCSACPRPVDRIPLDDLLFDPDEIEEEVVRVLSRARRCSRARSARRRPARCCSPGAGPGERTPLWQQRQRAADLLVGRREASRRSRCCSRPPANACATCSTCRRCARCMADLRSRRTKLVAVDTERASPFAQSLLFRWIAVYMYEGDAPLAERRAAALALDRDLLRELLGDGGAARAARPGARSTSSSWSCSGSRRGRRARNADDVHDLLRERRRPDREDEIAARTRAATRPRGSRRCSHEGRAIRVRVAGEARLAAVEDAARAPRRARRLAARSACPRRSPSRPSARSRRSSPGTPARTGRSSPAEAAARLGRRRRSRARRARRAEASGRVTHGEFRPRTAAGRRTRVVRRRRAPPAPSPVARRAPQGGRAGRRGRRSGGSSRRGRARAAATRRRRAGRGDRSPAGRRRPGVDPGARRPPRPCPRLPPGGPRRAVRERRPGLDRRRRARGRRRPRRALLPRPGARSSRRAPPDDAADGSAPRRDPRAPRRARRLVLARPGAGGRDRPTNAWCSPRSGTWSGPARSPTTRWRRSARYGQDGPAPRRVRAPARAPARSGATGPPAGAGRWSLVAPLLEPRAQPHRGGARAGACNCSTATASSPARRCWPRASPAGSRASIRVLKAMEESGKVRRGYFVAGLGRGAVRRCRARSIGSGRSGSRSAATSRRRVLWPRPIPPSPTAPPCRGPRAPGGPAAQAGAFVVLVDGELAAFLERGARSLLTFGVDAAERGPTPLATLAKDGRLRQDRAHADRRRSRRPTRRSPTAARGRVHRRLPRPHAQGLTRTSARRTRSCAPPTAR